MCRAPTANTVVTAGLCKYCWWHYTPTVQATLLHVECRYNKQVLIIAQVARTTAITEWHMADLATHKRRYLDWSWPPLINTSNKCHNGHAASTKHDTNVQVRSTQC
jgi:hypothetical protein